MSWTDERVEQLKLHWMEGKTASQIASLLGHGVSRNAVIGKVHRLGLAGRAKSPNSGGARPRRPAPSPCHEVATFLPPFTKWGIEGGLTPDPLTSLE